MLIAMMIFLVGKSQVHTTVAIDLRRMDGCYLDLSGSDRKFASW